MVATATVSINNADAAEIISSIPAGGYTNSVAVDGNGKLYTGVEFGATTVWEIVGHADNPIHMATIADCGNNRTVYTDEYDEAYVAGGYVGVLALNESSFNIEAQTHFSDQAVGVWSNGERHFAAIWNSGFAEFDYNGGVLWEIDAWTTYGVTGYGDTLVVLDTNPAVQLWDISEAGPPNYLGGWGNTAAAAAAYEGHLFVAMRGEGVVKLDVGDPENIFSVAANNQLGDARDVVVDGYKVYVADGDIQILDLDLNLIETVVTPGDANAVDFYNDATGHFLAVADGENGGVVIINLDIDNTQELPEEDLYQEGYDAGYDAGYGIGFNDASAQCVQEYTEKDLLIQYNNGFYAGVTSVEIPECVQDFTEADLQAQFDAGAASVTCPEPETITVVKTVEVPVEVQVPGLGICNQLDDLTGRRAKVAGTVCRTVERLLNRLAKMENDPDAERYPKNHKKNNRKHEKKSCKRK